MKISLLFYRIYTFLLIEILILKTSSALSPPFLTGLLVPHAPSWSLILHLCLLTSVLRIDAIALNSGIDSEKKLRQI